MFALDGAVPPLVLRRYVDLARAIDDSHGNAEVYQNQGLQLGVQIVIRWMVGQKPFQLGPICEW